jgi:hypothetical protein
MRTSGADRALPHEQLALAPSHGYTTVSSRALIPEYDSQFRGGRVDANNERKIDEVASDLDDLTTTVEDSDVAQSNRLACLARHALCTAA